MHCHASVAHNQILNDTSVNFSPFIGVELTCWKARTQPQVTAVFDLFETSPWGPMHRSNFVHVPSDALSCSSDRCRWMRFLNTSKPNHYSALQQPCEALQGKSPDPHACANAQRSG